MKKHTSPKFPHPTTRFAPGRRLTLPERGLTPEQMRDSIAREIGPFL